MNGIVTVVVPESTFLNVQRLTASFISLLKSFFPVVEDFIDISDIDPSSMIVNFKVTVPSKPGCFFMNFW